jgi:hypothetical protein
MPGIGIIIPRVGPGVGPTVPLPLHDIGVAGPSHRYIPGRADVAAGSEIVTLQDYAGTLALPRVSAAGAAAAPVVTEVAGHRILKTRGYGHQFQAAAVDTQAPFTVAVVARFSTVNYEQLTIDGYRMKRASNGQLAMSAFNDASAAAASWLINTTDAWAVMFMVAHPTDPVLQLNATPATQLFTAGVKPNRPDPNPQFADTIRWGTTASWGALSGDDNLAEMNIWPFALTDTQRAAHLAAMKAKWTGLLPA